MCGSALRDTRLEGAGDRPDQPSVLVVGDFTANLGKVGRHVGPLAEEAKPTMVCLTAADVDGVAFRTAPSVPWRPLGLCLMFIVALVEARRAEYDAVVSFSLVPHGTFGLVAARLAGCPAHVGIIGADLDVHAPSWYGRVVAMLLRRFDIVSVPGQSHCRQLHAMGVSPDRTAILTNPIDVDQYAPRETEAHFDLLWVGRFSSEKDPLLFVDSCRKLRDRGTPFSAAMVGDGPLRDRVRDRLVDLGLDGRVALPGWVDDPADYYDHASIFVLTSERDALPLTLIEAMASGCVPVVPRVGNVTDITMDGENAVVVDERSSAAITAAIDRLIGAEERLTRLSSRAPAIRHTHSMAAATADWRRILERMGIVSDSRSTAPRDRSASPNTGEQEPADA